MFVINKGRNFVFNRILNVDDNSSLEFVNLYTIINSDHNSYTLAGGDIYNGLYEGTLNLLVILYEFIGDNNAETHCIE